MSRKFLQPVIILFVIAILAIMALQAYWIRASFLESGKAFDRSVSESLAEVVRKLEKQETSSIVRHRILSNGFNTHPAKPILPDELPGPAPRVFHREIRIENEDTLINVSHNNDHITWSSDQSLENKIIIKRIEADRSKVQHEMKHLRDVSDSIINSSKKAGLIEEILSEFTFMGDDILKRAEPELLDSICNAELDSRGLYLPYNIALVSGLDKDTLFKRGDSGENIDTSPVFSAVLFPSDFNPAGDMIALSFPDKKNFIYHEMRFNLISSAAITLLLLFSFMYTIQVMLKQRKLDELKNDFINNLAHEFKTPVSTILIASEALGTEEVSSNKSRVVQLANIIKHENDRVSEQIERVLDLNRLESGSIGILKAEYDLNRIVQNAIESFTLQFEKVKAEIITDYCTRSIVLNVDALHLSNAIMNLLDNACKYGGQGVKIHVRTLVENSNYIIRVSDNGTGLNSEMKKKIFDKFFRVPTGNIHNVKGFGLGLSYVKTIAELHEGSVAVDSNDGGGSTFSILIPFIES